MTRARILTAAALVAATTLLAGCGASGGQAQGGDSEPLVVYSGRNEALVGPVIADFEAETGIDVDVRYGETPGMSAQLLEEGGRTPADLFWSQDAGALSALANEDLLEPVPAELAGLVPRKYRDAEDRWVAVTGRARAMVVDPAAVPAAQVPDSVLELTEPTWRGRVAIAPGNASFQTFVTAMRVGLGEEAARAWLEGIAANDPLIYESNTLILDAVESGQADLGLVNHYYWWEKAAEVGTDAMKSRVFFTAPGDYGSLVNVAGLGVLKSTDQTDEAERFVAYMLSEPAQTYFAQETFEYPMTESVPVAAGIPPLAKIKGPDVRLSQLEDLPGTVALLQSVGLV